MKLASSNEFDMQNSGELQDLYEQITFKLDCSNKPKSLFMKAYLGNSPKISNSRSDQYNIFAQNICSKQVNYGATKK